MASPSQRVSAISLLSAGLVGFLLWALSPSLLGVAEPWDTGHPIYSAVLISAGVPAGILGLRPLITGYIGVWLGQVAALATLPSFQKGWLLLGILTTGVGSLLFVVGAAGGLGIRSALSRGTA